MARSNSEEMFYASRDLLAGAEEGALALERTVARTTSVREGQAPGAPVDTAELRGSLRVELNGFSDEEPQEKAFYPIIGDAEVNAATRGFELGDTIGNAWIAEHANIIEGGRRASSAGFMIGSDQAPDGFVHLGVDEALSIMDRWRRSKS